MYSGLSPSFIVVDWWATESLYRHCHLPAGVDKRLSYRRETALQGGIVLAKSGRLELGDNILRTL